MNTFPLSIIQTRALKVLVLGIVAVTATFFVAVPEALACRMICSGGYLDDGINNPLDGVSYCFGTIEFEGCDGGGDSGGGGGDGGGGGGGSFYPDMTASAVSPQAAAPAQPQVFTATITNVGAEYAGESSTSFQRATDASGSGAYEIGQVSTGALTAGASRNVSLSHVFSSVGTYYIRACADTGAAVTETNEGNNCGAWTQITVSAPPFSVSCSVAPSAAQVNDTVLWSAAVVTGASGGLEWRSGPAFTTKICTGGQNATTPHRDCPEGIGNGMSCSVEGQRCRQSSGCDGYTYTDGSGSPNAHTAYGSVVPYTCTATGSGVATYTYAWSGTDGLAGTGQSLPWSYSSAGTKTGTVIVTASTGQTASATCSLPVTTQSADLTAGSATAPGASRGATATISAPILNIGGMLASASRAYYELTAPNSKSNASGVVSMGSIAASGSANASFNYTFGSAGNYGVRFCADWYGEVAESNEGNNCGPWTDIAIPETPISDSVSCTASATSVSVGQSVTYTASTVGAATSPYAWTPSDGTGSYGSGSTASRTFTLPGSYGMQVSATNASSAANCPIVTVAGGFCAAGTPDLTITATPNRLRAGQSTTLAWSASGVPGASATCTVLGPGVSWNSSVTASPQCSASGSTNPTITTQSTYTLTCGVYSESVTVNVIPNFQEF